MTLFLLSWDRNILSMKLIRPTILLAALALLVVCSAPAQTLVGAWTYGNTASPGSTGTGVFIFLPNGVYFHAESENVDDAANGQNGMERGTYTWNSGTGLLTLTSIAVNTNGQWGLSHDPGVTGSISFVVTGDTLTVGGDGVLARVTGGSAIVGAWTYGNTLSPSSTGTGVLVFLPNGAYFHAESDNTADAANGQNGMERGTYTWDIVTGAFTSNTVVNTNGQWGFSHESPPTILIAGDIMDIDGFTLNRVSAIPEPSTYAAIAGALCLGLVVLSRRNRR